MPSKVNFDAKLTFKNPGDARQEALPLAFGPDVLQVALIAFGCDNLSLHGWESVQSQTNKRNKTSRD